MDYYISGHLSSFPNAPIEELEARYNAERLKRKVHRKGPAPKLLGNETCTICGQWANGFHYNVLSCEGCKGFFRRTIINGLEYICKDGRNSCDLFNAGIRQRCQKCRIIKCLRAGMKANFVQKRRDEHNPGPYEPTPAKLPRKSVIIQRIPLDLHYLLSNLEKPWGVLMNYPCSWDSIKNQYDILEYMHVLKGNIIHKFLLQLPELQYWPHHLQNELINSCINELLILYLSMSYDHRTDSFDVSGHCISRSMLANMFGIGTELIDKIFMFFEKQADHIKERKDLHSIIAGIVTFAPDRRCSIVQYNSKEHNYLETITDLQDKCFNLLEVYLERYNSQNKYIAREIARWMTLLREINHEMENFIWRQTFQKLKSSSNLEQFWTGNQRVISVVSQTADNCDSISVKPEPLYF